MARLILIVTTGLLFVSVCLSAQDRATENLKTFAKLYGYIRYFHPSDEAAEVDWDQLAIYGAQRVREAPDSEALREVLLELFAPVAPTLTIYPVDGSFEFSQDALIPEDTSNYQTVAWQHLGVQLDGRGNVYRSKRTARSSNQPSASFGTLTNGVEAIKYQGNDIKLSASVKMAADIQGAGHLWLRVDRGSERGFFNNMNDRPITDTTWQNYEIIGTVAPDATAIALGCFLKGGGKLWVDDFRLYTKNPRATTWESVDLKNIDFEDDEPGGAPKSWFAQSAGYEFQVTDTVAAKGKQSVQIFTPSASPGEQLFDLYPKVGEVYQQQIGSGLMCAMPLALYGTSDHTYPAVEKGIFNNFIRTLDDEMPSNITGDDLNVRLGSIVIAWNVFQHFYPYFDEVSVDWNQALEDALQLASQDSSATDFLRTLRVLTAKLQDGHGRVYLVGEQRSETYFPPIAWEWVEDSLIITESQQAELQAGGIVTRIEGQTPRAYFTNVHETISAATSGWRDFRAREVSLAGAPDSDLELEVRAAEGNPQRHTLKREVSAQQYYPNYFMKGRSDTTFMKLEEGIYYVNIDKASMPEIQSHMDTLRQAESIIFDLRGYPNSNSEVISYLLTEPDTSTAWMQIPQIVYPDQENIIGYENHGWEVQPQSPSLNAKVIFITDGRAISYAESFMSFIEHYDLATIVGQPTAGTNGNVNTLTLPGNYRIYWTGMKVRKHDGRQLHGVGILPDVYVEKTIAGVRAGRDEFLEQALEVARGKQ